MSPLKAGMMRNIEVSDKIVAEQDKTDKTENQDELETEKEEPDVSEYALLGEGPEFVIVVIIILMVVILL